MRGADVWSSVLVPVVAPAGWTRTDIDGGLRELERIRRTVDAASAALITGLGTGGRDTAAAIVRATGSSGRRAREQANAALVAEKVVGAAAALKRGEVSAEHLSVLARIVDPDAAAELLPLAVVQSPEDFMVTVSRFELDRDSAGVRERQQGARSIRFFTAEHGCVGVRGVLTPIEGAELKARLTQITDRAWRREHPERAETMGGHGGQPLHARLADALMTLIRDEPGTGTGTGASTGTGGGSRPSIVVTVNAETLAANITGTGPGTGPIPIDDIAELTARADLYTAIQDTTGAILNFGRSRRLASPLQRLAIIIRDNGRCAINGCNTTHNQCDIHHATEFEHGGPTNLPNLALVCAAHHTHLHTNNLQLTRHGTQWHTTSSTATSSTGATTGATNATERDTRPAGDTKWADTG